MTAVDPFLGVADGEEFLAAACAAVAHRLAQPDDLNLLAAAHLQAAARLHARPRRRWRDLQVTLRALAAAVGGELGALTWLRDREQRLLDAYVALEGSPQLGSSERRRLRSELVPGAFDRFQRVDRLIQIREEQEGGVFA